MNDVEEAVEAAARYAAHKAKSLEWLRANPSDHEDPLEAAWVLGYGRGYSDGWNAAPDGW